MVVQLWLQLEIPTTFAVTPEVCPVIVTAFVSLKNDEGLIVSLANVPASLKSLKSIHRGKLPRDDNCSLFEHMITMLFNLIL